MRSLRRFSALLLLLPLSAARNEQECERLKATLHYTQEKAPRDLSVLLPVIVEKFNRVLDGVVDVDVEWSGADLHGRVGEHIVKCKVTRLASEGEQDSEIFVDGMGRKVTSRCFHVPFTITDTNECRLPAAHPMRHKCHAPAVCVNTIGSYECLCPSIEDGGKGLSEPVDEKFWESLAEQERSRTPWDLSFGSSRTSCPSRASTHGCCSKNGHSKEGSSCRELFRCPVDPCDDDGLYDNRGSSQNNRIDTKLLHDCAPSAQCVRAESPLSRPNFSCSCPKGLMGNGHTCRKSDLVPKPMVTYDGVTPTELTLKNNYYCGCTEPTIDACSGFPPCKGKHETCVVAVGNKPICGCKSGYEKHDEYGCVDIDPPRLKLKNDPDNDRTLRLKQGDEYKEYMVDIIDDNAEDYFRSLKITYSEPLPPGCLTTVGELHVNYTVAMPWATPPFVRVTRRIIVEDIDECNPPPSSNFQSTCPALVPQCDFDAGAKCVNRNGSYNCRCPRYSSGDGFLKNSYFPSGMKPPSGFGGGLSCVDTSKPVITLVGPNPKVIKTCACGRLSGIIESKGRADDVEGLKLQEEQRNLYEEDIKEMIRASGGAELCASHTISSPSPVDCAKAIDHHYLGDVDLSTRVVVGDPVQKSLMHWAVPYDVTDDAGNKAITVWRDVVVQEVALNNLETQIRQDVLREQEEITKKAIEKAVREERMKIEKSERKLKRGGDCPPCPKCKCPSNPSVNEHTCQQFCSDSSKTCSVDGAPVGMANDIFSSWLVPLGLCIVGIGSAMLTVRWFWIFWQSFGFQSYSYESYTVRGSDDLLRDAGPSTPRPNTANDQSQMRSPERSNSTPGSADRTQSRYSGGIFTSPPPSVSQQSIR